MSPLHRPDRRSAGNPDVLTRLATGIDDAFCHRTGAPSGHLIRVTTVARSNELELGLLPLEAGDDPASVMAGFTAPPDWTAVGVVTAGRSHEAGRPPDPVRLTFLLDRSGAAITLLTPIGAPPEARRTLREPPAGLIADACRRVLGQPTEPPIEGPDVWLTARWLDRLLAVAVDDPGSLASWDAAARLHPLIGAGAHPPPECLAVLVDEVSAEFDWERLRLVASRQRDGIGDPAVNPAVAAWMDAGSFARHVLASELPVGVVLGELRGLIPLSVSDAVHRALPPSCRDGSC